MFGVCNRIIELFGTGLSCHPRLENFLGKVSRKVILEYNRRFDSLFTILKFGSTYKEKIA